MRRDGFALPLAIAIMVAASIIALTALQVATSDFQANRATRLASRALFAADAGADRTVARWGSGPFGTLAPGDSASTGWTSLPDGSVYRSVVLRIDDGTISAPLYRVVTEGRPNHSARARRRIITVVVGGGAGAACCGSAVKILGDLVLRAPNKPKGTKGGWTPPPQVDGRDHVPSAWSGYCPTLTPALPGVMIDRASNLTLQKGANVEGTPSVQEDSSLDGTDIDAVGGGTYADLAANADVVFDGSSTRIRGSIRPSASAGACNTGDMQNWGAPLTPTSACWDYLPVIHAAGNLRIDAGGEGQGILLVDGDLSVTGAFDFYGVVVVEGTVTMRRNASITGTLLVGNRSGWGTSQIRDDAVVRYSACATARATGRMGGARFLSGRHWFEVP